MYDKQIDCIQDDGLVRFAEGSSVAADTILYCTGYDCTQTIVLLPSMYLKEWAVFLKSNILNFDYKQIFLG